MKLAATTATLIMLFTSSVWAYTPASGLMLGVRVFENWKGLRVMDTIPGYAADGVLMSNDVITRMADNYGVYEVRTLWQLEMAKDRVGPNAPAAIEVQRPGWGTVYFFVELTPVGGTPAVRSHAASSATRKMTTTIRKANDQQAAARMFSKKRSSNDRVRSRRSTTRERTSPGRTPITWDPADLFSRR